MEHFTALVDLTPRPNLALVERFLAIISYFRPHLWLPKTLVGNCFQDLFPCNTSKCVLYRNWNWKLNFSLLQFWHAKCREITAIVQLCSPGICMHSRQSACLEMPSSFMFAIVSSTVSPSVSHSAYQLREYIMECGHIHIYQRLYASPLPLCSLVGFFCLFVFLFLCNLASFKWTIHSLTKRFKLKLNSHCHIANVLTAFKMRQPQH